MKIEKFYLRSNNSVCAGTFQLLSGRAPAQLEGNIAQLCVMAVLLSLTPCTSNS
jgi:hypothetical protein